MALLTLNDIDLSIGERQLLAGVCASLERGDRTCLVGRNGEGKSTLMRLIAGQFQPDGGEIRVEKGARVAYVPQEPELDNDAAVFDAVAAGVGELGDLIARYHRVTVALESDPSEANLSRLQSLQQELEARDGWQLEQQVEKVISRLELDADRPVGELSGGWKRRVALGRALVQDPDLLMLDEPTNHLDIPAIEWLEGFLSDYSGTLLFITHDRRFLDRVATRIWELDRGQVTAWPGEYETYLRLKEAREEEEARQNAEFDRKLAQEEAWIRQGVKARRKRNQGRVRNLEAMREARSERTARQGTARMNIEEGEQSGRRVLEAEGLSLSLGGRPIVKDFSCRVMRGDRIGIIGPNGAGKSTLIKLLLGEIEPDAGHVKQGTKLQIAYFDQYRQQLDEDKTPFQVVADGAEQLVINGERRHVMSYLQDFLFSPERARTPIRVLSGGERNRLLLARLFASPANVLVMDEPTNDLDFETLEVLEDLLGAFDGTLLLISHDRAFLNHVVTSVFAFEADGIREYVGDYDDWLRQRPAPEPEKPATPAKPKPSPKPRARQRPRKLSYREKQELEQLPDRLEALEAEQGELQARSADPAFYQDVDGEEVKAVMDRLQAIDQELEAALERWEELESLA